jgi:hypothetical protein
LERKSGMKNNPSSISRPYILSEFLVDKPTNTSIDQIKAELKRKAREKAGLNPNEDFAVSEKPEPTLKYNSTPNAACKKQLDKLRKQANFTELKELEK